jgi:hypothetical protein
MTFSPQPLILLRREVYINLSEEPLQYEASDAWLLQAIIYAAGDQEADLHSIVAAGDGINHAIFTYDEMESGLYRLSRGGYIEEVAGKFKPSKVTLEKYRVMCKKTRGILKERDLLSEFLDAKPWVFGVPFPRPENRYKYPGMTVERFDEAVDQYQREARKIINKLLRKK